MRFITTASLPIIFAMLLSACVSLPLYNEGIDDPALLAISQSFENTVNAIHADSDKEWQSGWLGNMWVNFRNNNEQVGLCYQWQAAVYHGVKDTVFKQGWGIRAIAVQENTPQEHHAVVVFDVERIDSKSLLEAGNNQPVYVLDAWRQGRADIYHLADWLNGRGDRQTVRLSILR